MRPPFDPPTEADIAAVSEQLGRPARDVIGISARTSSGVPTVVSTHPRLADGTPFPTLYYLSNPAATAAISHLEANGVMTDLNQRLADEPDLAAAYRRAHESYILDREGILVVDELHGISAGGMPRRVKCLHALAAHALAAGPGVNPIGDIALAMASWSPDDTVAADVTADVAPDPEATGAV